MGEDPRLRETPRRSDDVPWYGYRERDQLRILWEAHLMWMGQRQLIWAGLAIVGIVSPLLSALFVAWLTGNLAPHGG